MFDRLANSQTLFGKQNIMKRTPFYTQILLLLHENNYLFKKAHLEFISLQHEKSYSVKDKVWQKEIENSTYFKHFYETLCAVGILSIFVDQYTAKVK